MFKKILVAMATLIASIGFAFAQVDVNKADQAGLDSIKGIGPVMSKKIIDERKKGGDFKDWADFQKRVKGVGEKNSVKMSQAGLTVNSQPLAGSPAVAATSKGKAKDAKPAAATTAVVLPTPAAKAVAAAPAAPAATAPASDAKAKDGKAKDAKAKADEKAAANASAAPVKK